MDCTSDVKELVEALALDESRSGLYARRFLSFWGWR